MSNLTVTCPSRISAIRAVAKADGDTTTGGLTQIEPGSQLLICGKGHNDSTVKVSLSGEYYFVFRQDVMGLLK